jgi:putative transposase
MPRPLRTQFEGALYHVTDRGNNKQAIFRRARDRHRFLDILEEVVQETGWLCYAYCLMRNHFHLLIETPLANLSKGMQLLLGHYAPYFNHTHNRVGHVFQGRYHNVLVEKEAYFLEVNRYVELNPVRAGICESPEEYPWSSFLVTAGQREYPAFVRSDKVLAHFGADLQKAKAAYVEYVREGIGRPLWDRLKEDRYLGSDEFISKMKSWELVNGESMSKIGNHRR